MTTVEQILPQLEHREIDIAPNQRYGFVGKTRSGKTWFAMALASILVPHDSKEWEAWWIDTKDDPKDIKSLGQWGFQIDNPKANKGAFGLWRPNKPNPRRLFLVRGGDIHEKVEEVVHRAYNQRGVLLIIDEYVQVVKSSQVAGKELLNVFQRGGGVDVGLIGLTQEPVYVPRQLLSQATHQFLFNVSYPYDIQYLQGMYTGYIRPTKLPVEDPEKWGNTQRSDHSHGFYHVAVDYDGEGKYFQNMHQWYKTLEGVA
jgi:energy-coupling factor transporter ATP-binding protein EcfA2